MMLARGILLVLLQSSVTLYGLMLDEACTDNTSCQEDVTNSVCDGTYSICTCSLSYKPDRNDTCVLKGYKDLCIHDDDCGHGNDTICYQDITPWCKCNHELGYGYDDTRKQCVQVCEKNQLYCNNGNCVNQTLRDNGINDCDDNTDEGPYKYCEEKLIKDPSTQRLTWFNQHKCTNAMTCSPTLFVRDTVADCNDQSDEYKTLGTFCNYNVPTDPFDCSYWMQDSVCDPNYECVCRSGAFANDDFLGCTVRVLGDSCITDPDCEDAVTNSECDDVNNICVCHQMSRRIGNNTCRLYAVTVANVTMTQSEETSSASTSNMAIIDATTSTIFHGDAFSESLTEISETATDAATVANVTMTQSEETSSASTSNMAIIDATTSTIFHGEAFSESLTEVTKTSTEFTDADNQEEEITVSNRQPIEWIIGGVVITVVICVTVIVVAIIVTRHRCHATCINDTGANDNTTIPVPALTELDSFHGQQQTINDLEQKNDPVYMEIQEDKPQVRTSASSYQNKYDKESVLNQYEALTPDERGSYIAAYSTVTTEQE